MTALIKPLARPLALALTAPGQGGGGGGPTVTYAGQELSAESLSFTMPPGDSLALFTVHQWFLETAEGSGVYASAMMNFPTGGAVKIEWPKYVTHPGWGERRVYCEATRMTWPSLATEVQQTAPVLLTTARNLELSDLPAAAVTYNDFGANVTTDGGSPQRVVTEAAEIGSSNYAASATGLRPQYIPGGTGGGAAGDWDGVRGLIRYDAATTVTRQLISDMTPPPSTYLYLAVGRRHTQAGSNNQKFHWGCKRGSDNYAWGCYAQNTTANAAQNTLTVTGLAGGGNGTSTGQFLVNLPSLLVVSSQSTFIKFALNENATYTQLSSGSTPDANPIRIGSGPAGGSNGYAGDDACVLIFDTTYLAGGIDNQDSFACVLAGILSRTDMFGSPAADKVSGTLGLRDRIAALYPGHPFASRDPNIYDYNNRSTSVVTVGNSLMVGKYGNIGVGYARSNLKNLAVGGQDATASDVQWNALQPYERGNIYWQGDDEENGFGTGNGKANYLEMVSARVLQHETQLGCAPGEGRVVGIYRHRNRVSPLAIGSAPDSVANKNAAYKAAFPNYHCDSSRAVWIAASTIGEAPDATNFGNQIAPASWWLDNIHGTGTFYAHQAAYENQFAKARGYDRQ